MEEAEQVRRSVTITPELNIRLRDFIAACMRHGIDLDYTKALNLFAELGQNWVEQSSKSERERARETWNAYLDYDKLEASEVVSDWYEYQEFRRWKATARKRSGR
ncbi:MAG: hypothetical protein JRN34_00015 [Nitrososphaerota archaeon]|nr:hypothetical protein [Nitrososphaerota archaeon]MDG6943211.1 hypothetical protein [Nitrososphaerota archaeon]MDG6950911.1 hypothetical protein [Nitrososphaerota archaeon]